MSEKIKMRDGDAILVLALARQIHRIYPRSNVFTRKRVSRCSHLLRMNPEKIPLDLSIFDDATTPKLTASDVYRLLGTKVMRGRFICRGLFFGLVIVSGVALILRQVPTSIAAFVVAVVFGSCAYVMERKLALARQISVEPSLVYWAHPTILRQHVAGRTIDINFITLHARTGWSFEVGMSYSDMLAVVAWLRSRNPDIRLGAYDSPTASADGQNG